MLTSNQVGDKLSEKLYLDFLMTPDSICGNNVEFEEFSIETLFKILEETPMILINTIDRYKTLIDCRPIYSMDPIDDGIDLKGIKKNILQLKTNGDSKSGTVKSIHIVIENIGNKTGTRT